MSEAPTIEVPPPSAEPQQGEGEAPAQSKKGAKKAEAKAKKEAEKARKAAEREAAQAAQKKADDVDHAKENYGDITPDTKVDAERVSLKKLGEEHLDKTIRLRAWIQNARMQGAKMAFVELREERSWSIQGVIAASAEGKPVSKQMAKWVGGLSLESFVMVEAVSNLQFLCAPAEVIANKTRFQTVKKPLEPVKSCKVSDYELHITKCYLVAPGPEVLGLSLNASNRPVGSLDDEEPSQPAAPTEGVENLSLVDAVAPTASLLTHLNNIVMHKRAPVQQAIADVRVAVRKLFSEYLESVRTSCLCNRRALTLTSYASLYPRRP